MTVYTDPLPTLLGGEIVDEDKWDDIHDALSALFDAPSSYTPVWSGTTTAGSAGNSTLTGKYQQLGHLAFVTINLTIGSTASLPTGFWVFSLPVAPASVDQLLGVVANDASTSLRFAGIVWLRTTTATGDNMRIITSGESSFGGWTQAGPIAWATSDRVQIGGWYWV